MKSSSWCREFESHRPDHFFLTTSTSPTEAKRIAEEITQGEQISLELTASQRLAVMRALEILAPFHIPIDVAAGQYAEARRQLGSASADIVEAVRQPARRREFE